MTHKFNYKWYLKDNYKDSQKNNLNVFGTFICGGGSTMGYKLAGYNHLGGVEIDPQVANIYKINHKPKYLFNIDIRDFNNKSDLPSELFDLDILDGSPPCSTFSIAGNRESSWGKEKKFREGQSKQRLDDLVFVYCDTIIKLKPKVFILENVKGIIQGNAKVYSKNIVNKMESCGYNTQVFCLNSATMGVPQKRERVFFIGSKKELSFKHLKLNFNEAPIFFSEIMKNCNSTGRPLSKTYIELWNKTKKGRSLSYAHEKGSFFNSIKLNELQVSCTIASASIGRIMHPNNPNDISNDALKLIGSYPFDYNFMDIEPKYLIGMSVPPIMTAQIANQIYLQWFKSEKQI